MNRLTARYCLSKSASLTLFAASGAIASACSTTVGMNFDVGIPNLSAVAPARPEPETQKQRDERMFWWREARFGMFVHWGLYAIPAGEWKGKEVPGIGEWIMDSAKIPPNEYEKLAAKFNPVKFNANRWAEIAANAGMKYIVITTKHHDGFCMFNSKLTSYDIVDATPFKRDVIRELAEACPGAGVQLCFYHSIMDWHQPDARGEGFPKYAEVLRGQVQELLSNYGRVGVMWFDGEWINEWTEPQGKALYDLCRGVQPNVIVNNRVGKGRSGMMGMSKDKAAAGDFGTPEQEVPSTGIPGADWESCMTMNDTWGFKTSDHHWKSSQEIIRTLIDVVSKGGNYLLNVGPTAEGEIPPESIERLAAVGAWMKVNGEAIYGTRAGPFRKLPWGRATLKGEGVTTTLYLHIFDWPNDGTLIVPGLKSEVLAARIVGDEKSWLKFSRDGDHVKVELPKREPDAVALAAQVIALSLNGDPIIAEILPRLDHDVTLDSADAQYHGQSVRFEDSADKKCAGYWMNVGESVSWDLEVLRPGEFTVTAEVAVDKASAGGTFMVTLDGPDDPRATLQRFTSSTGDWSKFTHESWGGFIPDKPGRHTLTVTALTLPGQALMNLRSVTLTRK